MLDHQVAQPQGVAAPGVDFSRGYHRISSKNNMRLGAYRTPNSLVSSKAQSAGACSSSGAERVRQGGYPFPNSSGRPDLSERIQQKAQPLRR